MNSTPEPLIASEVDLRDFDYMPFQGDRLFKSDTWVLCNSDEKVAALRLWWESWHQEPAGSLPNDDRLLAHLAGYGVAIREFLKIKANAMRGWILCKDGRLYHPIVCEIAEKAWAGKKKKATENERDRERKRRKNGAVPAEPDLLSGGTSENSGGTSDGNPAENALKGSGREETSSLRSDEPPVVPLGGLNGKSPRGTRLATDWQPDPELEAFARSLGLDPGKVAAEFRDYWHAKPSAATKLDWSATFRNWCRRDAERLGSGAGRNGRMADRPGPSSLAAAAGRAIARLETQR